MRLDVVSVPTTPVIERPSVAKPDVASDGEQDFSHMLMDVMKEVTNLQNESKTMAENFLTGRRPVEHHDLMIAMERASVAMQLTMQVRNKALEAYQEISRMQV